MKIAAVLRAIGLSSPVYPEHVDDQMYTEAVMENAVRESDKTVERLAVVAEDGAKSNARLDGAIERMKISSTDEKDVMAALVRGMKSR